MFLEVFSEIVKIEPKAEFILVGRGGLEDKIKRKVQDMKLVDKVHFLGVREDIPELMIMMDGFVFPSIHEGLGIVAVEAQAAGLPCLISSNVTSDVNIGQDVKMKDLTDGVKDWADSIDSFDYAISREVRCHNNYELITKAGYNIENEANELLKIYNS